MPKKIIPTNNISATKKQDCAPIKNIYNTYKWRKYTKKFKSNNRICAGCKLLVIQKIVNNRKLTGVVDHVIPISMGGSIWDERNHQLMHNNCHQIKRAHEKNGNVAMWKYNEAGEKIPIKTMKLHNEI